MPAPIQVDVDKQSANATAASLTITKPTNLADNDVLYAEISRDNSDASDAITVPSGWIALGSSEIDNGTYTCGIYRKVISIASGEPADYTWSWTSSEKVSGWITRVTGADNTTPEDVTPSNNTGDSNAPRCLSVTPVTTNTLILTVGGMNSKGAPNWTAPVGMSEFFDIASTGGGGASAHAQASAAEVNQSGIGATGDKDFATVDTAEWVAFLIAVRPSDPSDPPEPPAGLPTIIFSGAGLRGHHPPRQSSDGNFYSVIRTDADELDVKKATDPEVSWALQDEANGPVHAGTIEGFATVKVGDVIHMIAWSDDTYEYYTLDMSTDQWGVDQLIETVSDAPLHAWGSIAVRSNGDVIVVYAGDRVKVSGKFRERVYVNIRTGGTWGGPVSLDAAGPNHYGNPNVVKGPLTDDMHILWYVTLDADFLFAYEQVEARTLDPSDVLSTVVTALMSPPVSFLGTSNGVSYEDAGTQRMLFAGIGGTISRPRIYFPCTEDGSDDIVLGTQVTDDVGADGITIDFVGLSSIAELDGEIHQLYSGGGSVGIDQDLYYTTSVDDGATWTTPTEEIDDITVNFISANIYVRGIDTVLAYIYDEDGKQLYNEKVLIAGQTHQMML